MRGYSIEATRPKADDVAALNGIVPPGTAIYLSAVPAQDADEAIGHAARLRRGGFEPVPHLAVRAFASTTEIDRFLARLAAEAGVRQVLVIAGDRDPPAGSLRGALDVIDSGLLQRHGIRDVGIAGYPEGHPRIPGHELDRALADKIAAAEATGLRLHIVTQFCFDADAIIGWVRRLRDFGYDTPVRIGLAGPTSLPTLMRYASRCGVAASLQGLARHAGMMRHLFAMSAPDAIMRALAADARAPWRRAACISSRSAGCCGPRAGRRRWNTARSRSRPGRDSGSNRRRLNPLAWRALAQREVPPCCT